MEQNENMAVQDESFQTGDLSEEIVEEPQDDSITLEEATDEGTEQTGNEQPQSAGGQKEPGWFRQRWEKEVGKLTAQIRDEIRNEYEAQMAPMREYMLNQEATELVNSGKVKDMETAMELVRYRKGLPAQNPEGQPRNERGQFTSRQEEVSPATQARIDMLKHQADKIRESGGPDVIAEFRNNQDIKNKIVTGEMDFYDVAEQLKQNGNGRKPPSPMRSPNGASGASNTFDFANMSSEQFKKLEKRIQEGARISLR